MPSKKITFLGTGLMGYPMTLNLLSAGHEVTVWNRTADKAAPLTTKGATLAERPADAVRGADIIISMLSNGPATRGLQADAGLRDALREGALWIEMSSIKPEEARSQAEDLKSLGVDHLDAPVSGGTKGAEDGTLAIMVGGEAETFERAQPVLSAMGRPVLVGSSGAGQLAKLANQGIVATTLGVVAEAMLLIEKGGGDPGAVREALKGGFADGTILQLQGARMSSRDFEARGNVTNQVKDLDNLLGEAANIGLSLPLAGHMRDRFAHLRDQMDGGDLDHSAIFLELLSRNNVDDAG